MEKVKRFFPKRVETIEKCQVMREILLISNSRPQPTATFGAIIPEMTLERSQQEFKASKSDKDNMTMSHENSLICGPRLDLPTKRLPRSVEVHDSRLWVYENEARKYLAK